MIYHFLYSKEKHFVSTSEEHLSGALASCANVVMEEHSPTTVVITKSSVNWVYAGQVLPFDGLFKRLETNTNGFLERRFVSSHKESCALRAYMGLVS